MIVLLLIFSVHINYSLSSSLDHDGWLNIKLEHALDLNDPTVFTERGNVTVQSIRLGQSIVNQKPLTTQESSGIRDLAQSNKFYQIKATATSSDGTVNTFLSTVKACMLAESELDDRLSISIDYSGRVIGISLIIASKATCEGASVPVTRLKQFTTNVYVRHSENGPVPDTASYIQKIEREKEAKEKGEGKDMRSFFSKYWMYIVPIIIIMVISTATNPDVQAAAAR